MTENIWHEGAYGFWHLRLPGNLTGIVGWDSCKPKGSNPTTGYTVSFNGRTLVKRYRDLEEAKAACMLFARVTLDEGLCAIGFDHRNALREIANRAGAPTMSYANAIELEEQRHSLDWIAARAAEALKGKE